MRALDAIDFSGVLMMEDMCVIFRTSDTTVRRRLKAGTFPIPCLRGIDDKKLRWSGPVVKQWLRDNGHHLDPHTR